jgi:tripartite-type tricarboxylate transporter receptor subunit TctC
MKPIAGLAGAALLLAAPIAHAAWPNDKPIEIVIGYAAGGGTDIMARTMQPFMEKALKASLVITNKPGASGELGFTAIAQAKPDGYLIGMINSPPVTSLMMERTTRYQMSDFTPIANIVYDPSALSVPASSPIKNLKGFIAAAKAAPGTLSIGNTGVGSDDHLAMVLLESKSGIKLTHVPFSGSAPTRTALLGGHISGAALNIGEVTAFTGDAGKFTVIGVMGEKRWEGNPDAPTFREQGVDIVMGSYRGLAGPKNLPAEVTKALSDAVAATIKDPEFQTKAKEQFLPLAYQPADQFAASLARETETYTKLWAEMPWKK